MLARRFVPAAAIGGAVVLAACGGGHGISTAAAPARGALGCTPKTLRFHTLPGVRPTGFCVATRAGAPVTADDILVTPRPDARRNRGEQFGPMILSPAGKLLWFQPRPDKVHDLKVVRIAGRPALAFWQRHGSSGSYYQLLDDHYRPVGRVRAAHGYGTNLHELAITPDGNAWVSADVARHVRGVGAVIEFVVQELDLATGAVRFEWRSLDHVKPGDSYERRPRKGAWDYFHGNAIAPPTPTEPTVVISSRNTSSLYGVDVASGRTRWILGGRRDQFHLPAGWRFCAQHDAHRLAGGDVLLFDNGGTYMHGRPRCGLHAARAMRFRLDTAARRARLVRSFSSRAISPHRSGYFPGWVGSARLTSEGDLLVDWGPNRRITQIGADGRVDLLVRLQRWSYRAFPARWVGHPGGRPAIAVRRRGGHADVWASWNGATEIRSWRVLAGASAGALAPVGAPAPFADLETHLMIATRQPYLAVEALDGAGAVLGRSRSIR